MHLSGAAAVPCSKQHTAAAALVLHVLERVHDVRDAAQAEQAAETESPRAIQPLAPDPRNLCCDGEDATHCVVLPISYDTLVMARWPQAGQSAGAGERLSEAMGVAFW